MLTEERFAKILSILESMGSVTVQQLMTELNASESTIRRDLNALDANGQLTKVHGGAILKTMAYSTKDDNVVSRKEKNRDAKNKIAKYAAEQIAPGDFVYLDAGTTTELMIEYITSHQAVFVTNAISHAKRLAERGFTVYLLGGEFKAVTEAIVGEEAVAALEKYNFTKGFWGANGVSLQKGYSTPELKEAMVKKKSMENCKECFVLAAFDVFAEGNKKNRHSLMKGFREGWQCEVYGLDEGGNAVIQKSTEEKALKTVGSIDDFGEIFVNPGNKEVCSYELSLLKEFAENYKPDGIVLDRVRYVGLSTDFSECSRLEWEAYAHVTG